MLTILKQWVIWEKKMNIPVYTTARIHAGINRSYCMTEKLSSSVRYLEKQEPMTLEDFHIESFEVPHDGTDNVGYCIEIDGKVFSFLTDLERLLLQLLIISVKPII